ncbi:MAG: alpha-1 4-glucan-protein synthase, partial [Halobacteriales archaeon]|nr:alpha-1 4-glucan-protein synthase [Halobacteriales archaeon]
DEHGLYPRGYPYAAMGETTTHRTTSAKEVVVSQGLWTDVPDLDAVRILADGDLDGQATTRLSTEDYGPSFIVEQDQYLTICSMNLAFRREVVPAFYQLPMDDNPWDVGRFDDIWSGVILKRACDVVGSQVLTGHPLCRHEKAPRSTFSDLATEVPGLELNEHLWRLVDGVGENSSSYVGVSAAIAEELADGDWDQFANGGFLNYVGEHMGDWIDCLDGLETVRTVISADD